jgi:2-aminoadipate transaminase
MKSHALSQMGRRSTAAPISWLMELTLTRPRLISLAAGFTDNASLPVGDVRKLARDLLSERQTGQPALQYGTTAGDSTLRQLTAARLSKLDGAAASSGRYPAARTLITHGSQQLLYMVTEALCDPGDIVIVEDPTYFVYLGIVQSHGLQTRGVRMERDGLSLADLERVLNELKRTGEIKHLKLLYLVSYFQNPTGTTTSSAKKAAALELLRRFERAAGHPIYLLEDAAYRELRFGGLDERSALAVPGRADRVIYAGTYSKPFSTGLRVGFGLLPEALFSTVMAIKGNHDFGTANFLQRLLTGALHTGRYEKHLHELRRRYTHKARLMHAAIQDHFPPEVEFWEAAGGLYFWARLPRHLRTGPKSKLFQQALDNNVLYVPGLLCYTNDPTRRRPDHEMRISFGGAPDAAIIKGIARLGKTIREALRST